jgi:trans-aconitate methyltransferase
MKSVVTQFICGIRNLFDILRSVFFREITIRYGLRRLKSQILLVGRRFVDGVDWENYHKDYAEELRMIQRTNTILIEKSEIDFDGSEIRYKSINSLPLLPGHHLLYETILNLDARRVLEVGCGGGDHLQNLHSLNPDLVLFGVDRSIDQLDLFRKRHTALAKEIEPHVLDLTEPNSKVPNVDLIFSQAVLMHISEAENRFYTSFKNLFAQNSHIVLLENWTQHNFLDAAHKIINEEQNWTEAKFYFSQSRSDPKVKCLVISKNDLNLQRLDKYEDMLSGSKVIGH